MDEQLLSLLQQGIVDERDALIYNIFNSDASMNFIHELSTELFMREHVDLSIGALAFRAGQEDFIRTVIATVERVSLKLKTAGEICQSYLNL